MLFVELTNKGYNSRNSLSAVRRENNMKHVYLALLLAMTAVVFLFKFQNLDTVTVQFLSASLTLPLSLLLLAVYVLGMLTGGMLLSMVRSWVRGATSKPPLSN